MVDMQKTTEPKSDQMNADSLIGGRSITIKVTKVSLCAGDQPISINFEGDDGKPYKPCKSMRRVLVNCWGPDGNLYAGRSMTLYCDPKVKFGGLDVGGIRISHLSNIDKDVTMALTATRANKKPFTVKPLITTSEPTIDADKLKAEAQAAAEKGTAALQAFWGTLKKPQQAALKGALDGYKTIASGVDAKTEGCSDEDESAS